MVDRQPAPSAPSSGGAWDYQCLDGSGSNNHVPSRGSGKAPSHESCHVSHRPRASLASVAANLVTAGLGAGILSLPWAMAGASLLPSVATTVVVMALNAVTVMILIEAAERFQAFDLGSLLSHLPGRWGRTMQVVCNVFTFASVFLCLTGYVVVVADSLEPLVYSTLGYDAGHLDQLAWWSVRIPLLMLGAVGALPLCFLDQRRLSFSSSLGILVNIYLFAVVLALFASRGAADDCCLLGTSTGTITMFSSLMQCAIIQMCVLPMYEELENRSPRRFLIAVAIAFIFLTALFAAFSSAAYLVFGPHVQANVIQNLPWDLPGTVARVGLALAVLTVYPLILTSMIAPIRHWEDARNFSSRNVSRWITVVVVAASAVCAAFIDQLGTLNQINGALQVGCFIGLVPGFTGLFLLGRKAACCWRLSMSLLLVTSFAASALGLVYTSNSAQNLTAVCSWFVVPAASSPAE